MTRGGSFFSVDNYLFNEIFVMRESQNKRDDGDYDIHHNTDNVVFNDYVLSNYRHPR